MESSSIGLFEAKTHLSELVARAERGEEVIITRHNKAVAKLVPIGEVTPIDVERRFKALAELQTIGAGIAARSGPLSHAELKAWIAEGRR